MTRPPITLGPWAVSQLTPTGVTTVDAGDGMVRNVGFASTRGSGLASKDEEARANALLISLAPDHADIGWAMCVAAGRWEPQPYGLTLAGEFVINGLRFSTELDEFGVPRVTPALRAQIAKARGDAPLLQSTTLEKSS